MQTLFDPEVDQRSNLNLQKDLRAMISHSFSHFKTAGPTRKRFLKTKAERSNKSQKSKMLKFEGRETGNLMLLEICKINNFHTNRKTLHT